MHNYRLNRPLLAALLLAAGLAMLAFLAAPAQAGDSFTVDVSPVSQNGEPKDTVTYTITVENTGDNDDDYNLTITSSNRSGWQEYIIPSQLAVKDGQSETATLYVKIGDRSDAPADYTEYVSFRVESVTQDAGTKNRQVTATVDQVYGTTMEINGTATQNTDPDQTVTFSVGIVNGEGNGDDTVSYSHSGNGIDDWSLVYDASSRLDPDETDEVSVSVTPDINALAGLKSINFIGTSEDGETKSSVTINVRVNKLPDLNVVTVGPSGQDVEAGERVYYSFSVTNKGNAVDSFDLEVVNDTWYNDGWEASLDTEEISNLDVDESINLTNVLVIKAPANAAADDEATIKVKVISQANTSVYKTFTSRSTVEQDFEPKIRIGGSDTQSAKPDDEVVYTLNLTNEGNGDDDITLSLRGGNATWGTLGESSFTLAAGATESVELRVSAPKGTLAQNGYVITVRATSEDGITMYDRNVFLNVQQIFDISVSISGQTKKSGDPGDVLDYSILIKNKGNGDDTINLALEGDNADWGSIIEDVDLEADESITVNLTVNIDEDATFGDYTIPINGSSDESSSTYDSSTVTVSVSKQYKVDLIVSSRTGDPGSELVYAIRVQNQGTGIDSFALSIDNYPEGWIVQLESELVEDVPAGDESSVNLTVTIPSGEQNRAFETNITASSKEAANENPPKWVNTTVVVTTIVNQEFWIDLSVESSTINAIIGIPVTTTINIENLGTGDDIVAMSVEAPANWTALEFNTSFLNVEEGSSGLVGLSITVPDGTNKGDYSIDISGVSNCATCANGTKSQDSLTLTIKVELSRGVEINADVNTIEKVPGSSAVFSVDVKNTGDGSDTILLSILDDDLNWATVVPASIELDKDQTASVMVTIALPEYDLDNLTTQERSALEGTQYEIRVKAKSAGDLAVSAEVDLTTNIGQIYGAKLETVGASFIESYPSTEASENDRRVKFTLKLTNTGNRMDNINVETIATSYPDEWTVSIYTFPSCSTSFSGSIAAGQQKSLYLCVTPDQDAETGNFTIITEASAGAGSQPAVTAETTMDVREPSRSLTLQAADNEITLAPEVGDDQKNTARFKITVTNDGSHDDTFLPELDEVLANGWTYGFYTKNTGSTGDKWGTNGEMIEDGQPDDLWFIVEVDPDDVDEGNYSMSVTVKNKDEDASESISLQVNVEAPSRGLTVAIIDSVKEISPAYKGSDNDNYVKFKVKLTNSGTHPDTFLPELESTLDNNDWEVNFFQDSSLNQVWSSTTGVEIDSGELDDLWVEVIVDDEADEGNYSITISVRNLEDDPNARQETELTVMIEQSDLTLEASDITLEANGELVNGSTIKDGDTVTVKVKISNEGEADVDDALVEIYYYAKEADKTQDESEWLSLLYSKRNNFRGGQFKEIYSNVDWLITEGEWYVEVRVDYDEDDLDNGEILENNENNNDARFGELLRVKPDLAITLMRVDNRFAGDPTLSSTKTPNVDEQVTFMATVVNQGAADIDRARLYLTADSSDETGTILKERNVKDYYEFKINAGETTTVRFRWYAEMGEWSNFRAEVNPSCSEYSIIDCNAGDGGYQDTDRMYDELNRYSDNIFPAGGAIFDQDGNDVKFLILPDFKIDKFTMDPREPEVGDTVEMTVTVSNTGNSDWKITDGILSIEFDDGAGNVILEQVTSDINKGDDTEVKFSWVFPDEDKDQLTLKFELDAGSGNFEIDQLDSSNDEHELDVEVIQPAVVGEIAALDVFGRELVRGSGFKVYHFVALMSMALFMVVGTVVVSRRMRRASIDDDDEEEEAPEAVAELPPAKIALSIQSAVDGNTQEAKVKVPSNMQVERLVQNCVQKFPLPHANFAAHVNGAAVDSGLSLAEAGLVDGAEIHLVAIEE